MKVAGAWQEIGVDGGGMTWAKVSGGTVTTVNNPDGSVDEVHTFTANGTLTVESAGCARVLVCGGGGGSPDAKAGGGGGGAGAAAGAGADGGAGAAAAAGAAGGALPGTLTICPAFSCLGTRRSL